MLIQLNKKYSYPELSQDNGWTDKNKVLAPTQTRMTLKVLPNELPSYEIYSTDISIGKRIPIEGAETEEIKIKLWRTRHNVTLLYKGTKSIFNYGEEIQNLINIELELPIFVTIRNNDVTAKCSGNFKYNPNRQFYELIGYVKNNKISAYIYKYVDDDWYVGPSTNITEAWLHNDKKTELIQVSIKIIIL